ncbi:MAG TPA: metallophosphoesterase family protein [Anaerolineae bacterium]|nr:metallophosphoesterase family protein [Anaerolineae bacterium]
MKLAILSDIHANLHALQAVLADIDHAQPDRVICLGDLVGYGAHPNEVIDLIQARNIPTLSGNYDEGVGFDLADCGCVYRNPEDDRRGKQSLLWTRGQVTVERKEYLRRLPLHIRQESAGLQLLYVHGSPRRINEYLYEDRPAATFHHIAKVAGCDLLFFGHTHLPYQKTVGQTLFVNTGSVGKPKDGDPRAGYVLVELTRHPQVEFRRVGYDVAAAARAVRESGLPPHFADLLESGGRAAPPERAAVPRVSAR